MIVSPASASTSGFAIFENVASGVGAVNAMLSSAVGSVIVPLSGVACPVAVLSILPPAMMSASVTV